MRTLAISDIHGCSRALDTLLAALEPRSGDQVITLGDYVDRGPDTHGAIEMLLALSRQTRLIPLLGNHDQMMLESRDQMECRQEWLDFGGRETLASYADLGQPGTLADVPATHWEFLEKTCVNWFETDTHIFVHANLLPDLPLAKQPEEVLRWQKLNLTQLHVSGKILICGHFAQKTGVPLNLGHAVCIDTWVYADGWMTGLDVDTGQYWQTNQRRELRTGNLAALKQPG